MRGEFGYMEEGRLGKPYNIRLLRRLARYARPYKRVIALALFLNIIITLLDLAFPYLSKIAIDGYILSSYCRVDLRGQDKDTVESFLAQYGSLMEPGQNDMVGLIQNLDLKKVDPKDLSRYREKGLVSSQKYYKVDASLHQKKDLLEHGMSMRVMADGAWAIPMEDLDRLDLEKRKQIRRRDMAGVLRIGALLLALMALSFGFNTIQYYLLESCGQRIMQDIRLKLFNRIQEQSVGFFDRNPVGRLVTRVTNDVENLNELFKSVIVTVFKDAFILTGIMIVLVYLNWHLALLCFALIPLIFGVTLLFSNMAREAFRELREKVAKMNTFLQERLTGMRVIQLFAREDHQMGIFSGINHENYLAGMKQIKVFAVFMPVMELFASAAVALLIWYGGGQVIREELTLGGLVAFIGYIQMFFKPIRDISEKYNIMQSAMASTERIFEFMDHREEIPDPDHPVKPEKRSGHLRFQDVSFAYEPDRPVLQNVSFDVKPGEMVAVVGATGAGKTTLVSLIERFYEQQGGHILLDGIDVRQYSKQDLRSRIGLVMQDVFLFQGTPLENIVMGREGIGPDAVQGALTESNASDFIKGLPGGLNQHLGEGGATISAGERQLLSFARALAVEHEILILDEATSSVDPETERLIQEAISKITQKRTTLVVAHRLSTIRKADRIIVMHRGRICEQGNHDELMALRGIYYKLNQFREL